MNKYTVYMHTAPNGKRYIGITQQKIEKRWQNGYGYSTQIFGRAVKKYGWNNITHKILCKDLTEEQAKLKEKELIAFYNTTNKRYGYNQTDGGDSALSRPCSEKNKILFGENWKGEKNPRARKVICLETLKVYQTINDAQKDTGATKVSDCCNHRKKHRTSNGFHWEFFDENKSSDYYKELLETNKRIEEKNKHRPMSSENKEKLMNISQKPIRCVETNTIYESSAFACRVLSMNKSELCKALKTKSKIHGCHWEYV